VGFGDIEVVVRPNIQFKAGEKVLFVGDHMRLEKMGNTEDLVISKDNGKLTARKLSFRMVFHEGTNHCSIDNFLDELPPDSEKEVLAIYKRFLQRGGA
jgi:hypothetical protein